MEDTAVIRRRSSMVDISSARGLDAFLQNLPTNALENIVAASNIPRMPSDKLPRPAAVAKAEQTLRKWSSQPDMRQSVEHGGSAGQRSDSPALLAPLAESQQSSAKLPRAGSVDDMRAVLDRRPKQHFFMPLLHVLPEQQAMSASVKFNRARHVVSTLDIKDSASAYLAPSMSLDSDDGGSITTPTRPCLSAPVQSGYPVVVHSFCNDPSDEHLVAIDEEHVRRTINNCNSNGASRRSSSLHHSKSAFDVLYDSTQAQNFNLELDAEAAAAAQQEPLQPAPSLIIAILLLPSLSFEASRVWLKEISRLNKLSEVISSFPVSRRGILYRRERRAYDPIRRRLSLSPAWQAYMCELRGPFVFFFAASTQFHSKDPDEVPLPLAYIRLSAKSQTDISYDYLKRQKKHVLTLWRNGVPGLMLPNKTKALPCDEIMDVLQASSENCLVAWALAIRDAVQHIVPSSPEIVDDERTVGGLRSRAHTLPRVSDQPVHQSAGVHHPRTTSFNGAV